jgi:hypothetical protein
MQNRKRPKMTITVSEQTYKIITKLSSSSYGSFVDECVESYLTGGHMGFVTLKYGHVEVVGDGACFYCSKYDDERISPEFANIGQCIDWLSVECPELKLGK